MPYYKKVGNRYFRLAQFEEHEASQPAEGIWIVYDGPGSRSRTRIAKIDDLDRTDLPRRAALEAKSSEVCKIIRDALDEGVYIPIELVHRIFSAICKKEKKPKQGLRSSGFKEI